MRKAALCVLHSAAVYCSRYSPYSSEYFSVR